MTVTFDSEKGLLIVEDESQEDDFDAFAVFFTTAGDLEFRNNSNESTIVLRADIADFMAALEKLTQARP